MPFSEKCSGCFIRLDAITCKKRLEARFREMDLEHDQFERMLDHELRAMDMENQQLLDLLA